METYRISVPVPSMGATVYELTLLDVLVQPGTPVTKGQKLAAFESDKSVFDFESPCDGRVLGVTGRPGDVVAANAPFLTMETADVSLRHLAVAADGNGHHAAAAAPAAPAQRPPVSRPPPPAPGRPQWTPRALKLAAEAGVDPATVPDLVGTGPGGRVSGDDFTQWLEKRAGAAVAAVAPSPQSAAAVNFAAETVRVAGVGFAVPKNVRFNAEILQHFPGLSEESIVGVTGIRERRHASPEESATELAAVACRQALAAVGLEATAIDAIVMATIIPDQPVPSAASALAKALGIRRALAFDVNAACSGFLYALEIGRAFIRGGTARRVLVVTAELLSRITNPKDQNTAFLFGDGAGAAVLDDGADGHRLHRLELSGDSEYFSAIQRLGGGARLPLPEEHSDMDQFFLQMDGPVVFKRAVLAFADIIEGVLRRHGLRPEDVSWVVPHQANERILQAVSKRLGIPYERFVMIIAKYGNTSAASVSMALGWAAGEGVFNPGDKIVFCSVGAGFTFAGGLLVW
jgi:3-oxoacyl-(acyl-carrier-protein) synthase III